MKFTTQGFVGRFGVHNGKGYTLQVIISASRKLEIFGMGDLIGTEGQGRVGLVGTYLTKFSGRLNSIVYDKARQCYMMEFIIPRNGKGKAKRPEDEHSIAGVFDAFIDKHVNFEWDSAEAQVSPEVVDLRPSGPSRTVELTGEEYGGFEPLRQSDTAEGRISTDKTVAVIREEVI